MKSLARPRKIDDRKICLHPHDRDTERIQHIDSVARGRHYIPVAGQLDAVRNAILREEEGALVRETGASVQDVECVDGLALPGDVSGVWDVGGGGRADVFEGQDADGVD